jgi:hypothetical membrane protein
LTGGAGAPGAFDGGGALGAATDLSAAPRPLPRDASRGTLLLLACGIAGPVLFWLLGLGAMLSWPGYDPVTESISGLIYAPRGWLQEDAFILLALLTMAFAVGMGRVAGVTSGDRVTVRAILIALAAIELGFALFPANAPDGSSFHGTFHTVMVFVFAIAFPIGMFRVGRILRRDPPWWRAGLLADAAAAVMAVAILGVLLAVGGPLEPWTGVLERIWVAIPSMLVVGLALHGLLVATGRIRGRATA